MANTFPPESLADFPGFESLRPQRPKWLKQQKARIFLSAIDPSWAVNVYSDQDYPESACGYYLYRTGYPDNAFSREEARKLTGDDVVEELTAIGRYVTWGK